MMHGTDTKKFNNLQLLKKKNKEKKNTSVNLPKMCKTCMLKTIQY